MNEDKMTSFTTSYRQETITVHWWTTMNKWTMYNN